jgi:hypothetical protein
MLGSQQDQVENEEFAGQIQQFKLVTQEVMLRLKERLSKLLLFNIKSKQSRRQPEYANLETAKEVYELTRLEWFIKTNQSEPLLGFNDGLLASKMIARVLDENQEDEGVTSILDEIKDQVR